MVLLIIDTTFPRNIIRVQLEQLMYTNLPVQRQVQTFINLPSEVVSTLTRSQHEGDQLDAIRDELSQATAERERLHAENRQLQQELAQMEEYALISPERRATAQWMFSNGQAGIYLSPDSKVQSGDLVFAGGVLIGRVAEISARFATVDTVSGSAFSVVGQTSSGVQGVVQERDGYLRFDYVAVDAPLETEQFVYTAGTISERIPKGLLIGEITQVVTTDQSATKYAVLDQPINLQDVFTVVVMGY